MNTSPENTSNPEFTVKLTNEQMFDRIADLPDREFFVVRTDGSREKGWSIVGAGANTEGRLLVSVMNQDTEDMKRGIDAETFLSWQDKEPSGPEAYYVVPMTETPVLDEARITAQQFANEVKAAEKARDPSEPRPRE